MTDINIKDFCNIQGVNENDKFVLLRKYSTIVEKPYSLWYKELISDFNLGKIKPEFFDSIIEVDIEKTKEVNNNDDEKVENK